METNLSRRGFLTGAAAAGALAAMGLAGCAPSPAAEGGTKTADTGAAAATSWRDKPEMPTEFVETIDADIVVVGAGNGGLVAATTAAQNGAKVIVLEKIGNIAMAREAIGALNSKLAPDHQEDVPTLLNHANQTQSGDANMLLYKTWAEKSGEMIEWMADTLGPKGMLFPFEWHCPDDPHAYYPAMCYNPCIGEYNPDGPNYNSYAHLEVMRDVFTEDLGGEIRFECPAQQLIIDEAGRVTGVVAEGKEGFIQVNAAKGVILATGDYGGNQQMIQYYMPRVLEDGEWLGWPDTDAKGNVTNIGEGLQMAHWVGARTDYCHAFPNDHYGGSLGCDPMLFVDGSGERFMNEDVTGEVLGEKVTRVNGRCIWQIFDDNYPDQISHMPVGHRCYWQVVDNFDDIPMGLFLDPIGMITRSEVEMMTPCICDTIEELAAAMEVPADTLKATIDRYNELCDKGVDEDFGKRADRMAPVKQPPFYAAKMPTLGYQTFYGSVCCDYNMHAVDMDNRPIPGLYVGGKIMGSRFWHIYPNTTMGMNHAGALCYGRLAAKNAVAGI